MVLFDFKGKKTANDNDVQNISQNEENTAEVEEKEEVVVEEKATKKRYVYIALNSDGEVILNDKEDPFFQTVEEGTKIVWNSDVHKYAGSIKTNERLRAELSPVPPQYTGADRKKANDEIKNNAKDELRRIATPEIEEARNKLMQKKSGTKTEKTVSDSIETVQNETSEKSEKLTSKVYTEETEGTLDRPVTDTIKAKTENVSRKSEDFDEPSTIATIEKTGDQISQDINAGVEDILETIARKNKDMISDIKEQIESQGEILDGRTKKYIKEAASITGQKTQKASEDVIRCVNGASRSIGDSQEKVISKVNGLNKRMGEFGESIESIEGDLHKLDQLEEIAELLRSKGLIISNEIPPVNAEEEDIINLVRYSQKITEQLGYAARDLIRKQESFKHQAESNENEQRMITQKIEKAFEDGVAEGKKKTVIQLLSKYEDVDAIKDSQENYVHVIWTLLTELGVVIDGEGYYEKGKEIKFSEEDIQKLMATYSKFEGSGKYRVVKTGLSLHGEIISVAQFEKVIEDVTSNEQEASTSEESTPNEEASEQSNKEENTRATCE